MTQQLLKNTDETRKLMNEYGSQGRPFLSIIDYEMNQSYFVTDPLTQTEILFEILGQGNKKASPSSQRADQGAELKVFPATLEQYAQKFETIQRGLKAGNIKVVNLTMRTKVETTLTLDEIFQRSQSPYQILVPGRFVCFSPERFVKIEGDIISTNPMKGTIDAATPNAEQTIIENPKELAEHTTVVELLRNELEQVAESVEVIKFRYIDRIQARERDILQVSSLIQGRLRANYQLGDIIFEMLPGGSIAGTPKEPSLPLLQSAEGEPRGFYTGIFCYFDGKRLDSGVLIRFIEQRPEGLYYRSGGGITQQSVCEKEYQEMLQKIYLPFQ